MEAKDSQRELATTNGRVSPLKEGLTFQRPRIDLWGEFGSPGCPTIRCLPDLVMFNAKHNPEHLFCVQAKPSLKGINIPPARITFLELHHAVATCCRWIKETVPSIRAPVSTDHGDLQKGPSIALLLESDVGLFIHLVALLSLGIPCVLLSIRLSSAAIQHLLHETSAASVLVSSRTRRAAEEAISTLGVDHSAPSVLNAVPYGDLLSSQRVPREGLSAAWGDQSQWGGEEQNLVRKDDTNVLVLHSSGTTGLPKPIKLAHRYLLGYATCHRFPEHHIFSRLNVSTLPLYHGFGLLAPCLSLSVGMAVCLLPSSTIPSGKSTVSLIEGSQASSLMTVPSILEDIVEDTDNKQMSAVLAGLDFVAVGGGAIKSSVGEVLSGRKVPLLCHYGTTEIGALAPIFIPDEQYDWRFLRLRSDLGLQLKYASDALTITEDNARHGEIAPQRCKVVGFPFGWGSAFEVQDDLECNPLHPDTEVRILGRSDDLIVLATGEKIRPHHLEQSLAQSPLVKAAVAFGNGRFELGVIVEPVSTIYAKYAGRMNEYFDSIWQIVFIVNAKMDHHAQISSRSAVIIAPPSKLIPRSDKGSPMRKETYITFREEIDAVYKHLKTGIVNDTPVHLHYSYLEDEIQAKVQECVADRVAPATWDIDQDLFELGMDSLQATRLLRTLRTSVVNGRNREFKLDNLPRDFVYSNPSVSQMSMAIHNFLEQSDYSTSSRTALMENMVLKYSTNKNLVLLTGSTGNLGANLLENLCQEPSINRIICLIRPKKPDPKISTDCALRARQEEVYNARKIVLPAAAWLKVEFLPWDAGADRLGLEKHDYSRITSQVTHILHTAWPMDFRRKLESFEPHIRALKSLIELGIAAHRARPHILPRLLFASSIAAVGQYPLVHGKHLVPESTMGDPSVTIPMGYAEAKWVCEKIIEAAVECHREDIQPFIVRIGQVSGSEKTGYWNPEEHLPALVKASQALGLVPDLHGSLSWFPVNRAARVLVEMLLLPGSCRLIYHLENPARQPWSDVCILVSRKLGLQNCDRIAFQSWLESLVADESHTSGLAEFFEAHFLRMATGDLVLDTQHARAVSNQLVSAGPISPQLIELYIDSWRREGFLS